MSEGTQEFSPVRIGFMWPRVTGAVVLCTALTVGAVIATAALESVLPLGVAAGSWLMILPFSLFAAHVAWTKETYEVHPTSLVCKRGGLVSDGRNELEIRNITHVRLRLPWLRYRLFKIGDVRVESAGSAASEITFQSVTEPEALYDLVLERMQENGFALTRERVLHEESPTVKGAITDILQTGVGAAFTLFWLGFIFLGAALDISEGSGGAVAGIVTLLFGLYALLSTVGTLGGLSIRYLDLTRRTYTVHNDAVTYTEGFLTRDNAFIPGENIADASTKRTFVDQILGLYDVTVSCQGSGSEIQFRRLSRGAELKEAISEVVGAGLKVGSKQRSSDASAQGDAREQDSGEQPSGRRQARAPLTVKPEDAWTGELKMHMARTLVPLLVLLPTGPAWLIATVAMAIRASKTTYQVGTTSISSDYTFIGSQQQQFAYDKVTGVQVTRSPLDALFKTCTIQIWSIGAPMPLIMTHIPEADLDIEALLAQCGIAHAAPEQGRLRQSVGPVVWGVQNAPGLFILALLAAGCALMALLESGWFLVLALLLALLPIPGAIYTVLLTRRQCVTFHADHLEARGGVLIRHEIHVRYDNIKKVESVRTPLTNQGHLKLYVAGERVVQQQNQAQQNPGGGLKIPYFVQAFYIEDIASKVDAIDAMLLGRIEPDAVDRPYDLPDGDVSTKPAIANSVVLFLLIPPLWLFVPFVAYSVKVRRYDIEADRVVHRGGIFYTFATSVLYDRIDSMQKDQGPLGKAFGNGQVTLLTAGSSRPDLVIANVPDFEEVYGTIRSRYGSD